MKVRIKVRIKEIKEGENTYYRIQCKKYFFWWDIWQVINNGQNGFCKKYYSYIDAKEAINYYQKMILESREKKKVKKVTNIVYTNKF